MNKKLDNGTTAPEPKEQADWLKQPNPERERQKEEMRKAREEALAKAYGSEN